jgi:hypothetical protein
MMFTCEQLLGRTSTCSHILDSSSADDLRFSPTPGTIPRAIDTSPSPSITAFSFPMLARVRCERSTGRWWRMGTRTKRAPPIGGVGARSQRFRTRGQALLHRRRSRRRVVGRPRSSTRSQADCLLFNYYATHIYPTTGHWIPLRANLKAAASALAVAAVRPRARAGTRVRGCEVATRTSAVDYLSLLWTCLCGRLRALRDGDTSRRGQVSAPRPAHTLRANAYLTI